MATKKSAGRSTDPRRNYSMKIDFFRLQADAGGSHNFRDALRQAGKAQGKNRSAIVAGERYDLYECDESGSLIQGQIGRVRMDDPPAIANEDCTHAEIDLLDNQGVTERTAFLFDVQRSLLLVHSRREAASASRIAGYCDQVARNTSQSFLLLPLLKADAEAKFNSMTTIKKVDVEYAKGGGSILSQGDQSTRAFLRQMRTLGANTLTLALSGGTKKADHLSFDSVMEFIQTALSGIRDQPTEVVQKLRISGLNAGDERLVVDMLEDRLRVKKNLVIRGKSASYEQRRTAVFEAYQENLPIL